jgi:hypothetical protein
LACEAIVVDVLVQMSVPLFFRWHAVEISRVTTAGSRGSRRWIDDRPSRRDAK